MQASIPKSRLHSALLGPLDRLHAHTGKDDVEGIPARNDDLRLIFEPPNITVDRGRAVLEGQPKDNGESTNDQQGEDQANHKLTMAMESRRAAVVPEVGDSESRPQCQGTEYREPS